MCVFAFVLSFNAFALVPITFWHCETSSPSAQQLNNWTVQSEKQEMHLSIIWVLAAAHTVAPANSLHTHWDYEVMLYGQLMKELPTRLFIMMAGAMRCVFYGFFFFLAHFKND